MVTLLTFLAAAMGSFAVYSVWSDVYMRDRTRVAQRLGDEFRRQTRERIKSSRLFRDGVPNVAEDPFGAPTMRQKYEILLLQSGSDMSYNQLMQQVVIGALGPAALVGLFSYFVAQVSPLIVLALVCGLAYLGGAIPIIVIKRKRAKRQEKMFEQLPDAFDLMSRVIRAGQTMPQAMQSVANEFPQPIAGEFATCSEQQNLGLSPDEAMRDLARRTGLVEVKIFVLAVIVQRQTGGNMAGLLDNLSHIVRDRFRIKALIRTLTAEGRLQAWALLGLPPGLGAAFMVLNPPYMQPLLSYPGYYALIGMFICEFLGWLFIRKIINFDF